MRISVKESIPNNTTKILDNNKQTYRIFLVSLSRILQNFQSRRAISDIIVSLLLVAMTVIGGIIVFGIVRDSGVAESVTSDLSQPLTFEGGIKINGYDARDGQDLMGINIDNDSTTNEELDAGEEFILLKISNNSPNSIFLNDVIVNEVSHTWDSTTTGALTSNPSNFGKFIIIPGSGTDTADITPRSSVEINGGTTVRVVIALSSSISPDIGLNDAIRIKIDATGFDLQNFIITAGNTR